MPQRVSISAATLPTPPTPTTATWARTQHSTAQHGMIQEGTTQHVSGA
jgi:hypothetical protein